MTSEEILDLYELVENGADAQAVLTRKLIAEVALERLATRAVIQQRIEVGGVSPWAALSTAPERASWS